MKKFLLWLLLFVCVSCSTNDLQVQVWDFGAEQFPDVQNMLSVEEINSWYLASVESGSNGVNLLSFSAVDKVNLTYNANGANNHRLRTMNLLLTRYDERSLKDKYGNVYQGYIYSNSCAQPLVYLEQTFEAGDIIDYYVSSNGKQETYCFVSPSGDMQTAIYSAENQCEKLTFYCSEKGKYRFYGLDEKLCVARIVRTPAAKTKLSGMILTPENMPDNFHLHFINETNHSEISVQVPQNRYHVSLFANYDYRISIADANGFVIVSDNPIHVFGDTLTADIIIDSVDIVTLSGAVTGLPDSLLNELKFNFEIPKGKTYEPEYWVTGNSITLKLEKGVEYAVKALNVNDFALAIDSVSALSDGVENFVFESKPAYKITILPTGLSLSDLQQTTFVFKNLNEQGSVYTFLGPDSIFLRDGVYSVKADNFLPACQFDAEWKQLLTSNLVVSGAPANKTIDYELCYRPKAQNYRQSLEVGPDKEFTTIHAALDCVRNMKRPHNERVTIFVQPGNYEEMLKIDMPNITLRNAASVPSLALKNKGVDIDKNAVRITSYYMCGYNYFSMDADFMHSERVLKVNKENGYAGVVNQGGSSATSWNATVVVSADGFEAYGIIFENSANQYVSRKESEDIVVLADKKLPQRPTDYANVSVQNRLFRERACALAFVRMADRAYLNNCRIVGRQDALYGDMGCRVAIDNSVLMGSCDYIFGGMTLACRNTRLAMLCTSNKNDFAYLTASRTNEGCRGYLFCNCTVASALPEIEMADTQMANPGYLGRPWASTAETVFCNTVVETDDKGQSLIHPDGWSNGLSAYGAQRSYEYGTVEKVQNKYLSKRVKWSHVLDEPCLPDGTTINLYNWTCGSDGWNPFNISGVENTPKELEVQVMARDGRIFISNIREKTQLTIYSVDGGMVENRLIRGAKSTYELQSGYYLVVLESRNGKKMVKVAL